LRTARGAGRDAGRREDALEPLRLFEELGRLLVLRDRVLEPLLLPLAEDVLELRDPGGEDVRVAMLRPYGQVTPATGITGLRVAVPVTGRVHTLVEGETSLDGRFGRKASRCTFLPPARTPYGDLDHPDDKTRATSYRRDST
jgi:hypothetical protein